MIYTSGFGTWNARFWAARSLRPKDSDDVRHASAAPANSDQSGWFARCERWILCEGAKSFVIDLGVWSFRAFELPIQISASAATKSILAAAVGRD